MNKSELRERLVAAFADVPYPGDGNIGALGGRDEGEAVSEAFHGRAWQSLKPAELWVPWLSFLTDQAFHYYFPAYLLACLEDEEYEKGDFGDALLRHLTPPLQDALYPAGHPRAEEIFQRAEGMFRLRYRDFTAEQKGAIGEFLGWFLEGLVRFDQELGDPPGEYQNIRASMRYWKGF